MTTISLPTYADVEAAAQRIAGHANRTPVNTSRTLNDMLGAEVFFKCENFQRMGAFKFRGAFNALSKFTPEQRKGGVVEVELREGKLCYRRQGVGVRDGNWICTSVCFFKSPTSGN